MASFEKLIESKKFLNLFIHSGAFRSTRTFNIDKAEEMWAERDPHLEWDTCEKCGDLAYNGRLCGKHYVEQHGEMIQWQWVNGDLYKYVRGEQSYVQWKRHVLGEGIGRDSTVITVNGNPFDLRPNNLVVAFKITAALVRDGHIPVAMVGLFDDAIEPFLKQYLHTRGRKKNLWTYGLDTIARALGMHYTTVTRLSYEGRLNPADLGSVVKYALDSVRSAG